MMKKKLFSSMWIGFFNSDYNKVFNINSTSNGYFLTLPMQQLDKDTNLTAV